MDHEKLLNTAKKNFSYVQKSELYKFKYMNSWCFEYSKFLKNEVNTVKSNSDKKKFKRYPKGTIIYVKLGINIGNEFSGNHFCMVLNKKDSEINPVLTVIPLTSSRTRFNVKIDEDILPLAKEAVSKKGKIVTNKLRKNIEQILDSKNPNDSHLLKENRYLNDEIKKLTKVMNRYDRFKDTKTYANILNITTVSKFRISKINSYDPAGEMRYSEATLNKIDSSFKNRFLN